MPWTYLCGLRPEAATEALSEALGLTPRRDDLGDGIRLWAWTLPGGTLQLQQGMGVPEDELEVWLAEGAVLPDQAEHGNLALAEWVVDACATTQPEACALTDDPDLTPSQAPTFVRVTAERIERVTFVEDARGTERVDESLTQPIRDRRAAGPG